MKTQIKNVHPFNDGDSSRYGAGRYRDKICEHISYASRLAIALEILADIGDRPLDVGCTPVINTKVLACWFHTMNAITTV